jgi:RsiW-degrading membrane proteinase PrsW (M82 family)
MARASVCRLRRKPPRAVPGPNCYSSRVLDPQTIELLRQFGVDPANLDSLIFSAVVVTVLTLVAVFPTVIIAGRKRRSQTFWLLFALSIPVLPLLLVWLLPALPAPPSDPSKKP